MNGYKYDAISNTLTISRAFEKRAMNLNTDEYALYYMFRRQIPDAVIIVEGKNKTQRDVSTKEMESYIKRCNNPAMRLKEFNRQMVLSKVQKHPVKYMRNWFHENYANYSDCPEYKDGFVIVKTKAQMEAEQAALEQNESEPVAEDKESRASAGTKARTSRKHADKPSTSEQDAA